MLSSGPISRPRPPSQTRRPPPSPARLRTQSHTPARARPSLSPTDAPPPYSEEKPETNRHSLTEIDDMLNVAGSVVRNRERELDAAALASRSLLEENKLMFAKREALLARLPISPRTSLSAPSHPADRQHTNRSSSWSTCSDDSDMDVGTSTPKPNDALEAHRIVTPTHSASQSLDIQPPAARLVPTQAERIAALHAGLSSPPPPRHPTSTPRRVSVSPAAVNHLQEANSALLARVQELEEATAKAQSEGAARMRRLQAEAETLRARLGEAERANEGLRTEAEREKEKKRVRAQSAGSRQHRKEPSDELVPPVPTDFAPGATWRPEFRSLRGGTRPAIEPKRAATATVSRASPARALSTIAAPNTPVRSVRPARAQSNAIPLRNQPVSPMKHTPVKPSMLRHQRANSYAGLGKIPPIAAADAARMVSTVVEEATDVEGSPKALALVLDGSPRAVTSPMAASPTQYHAGVLPFPSVADADEVDMSPMSTRLLAQELVAKINELQSTNEEIQQQRDSLKEMLQRAQAEADDLKRVCERLEHEVEVERSASGSGGEEVKRHVPGLQLEIPPLGMDLDEAGPAPGWTGSVRGRKKGGAALQELAAELGAELQDDGNATDVDPRPPVDLASELAASLGGPDNDSKPSTPVRSNFGSLGLGVGHPSSSPRSRQVSTSKPSSKRGLGNRGMATRAKTNPRRVRKSLSSVVFGKSLPSPVSSPTTATGESPVTPARSARDDEEFVTPRTEFGPSAFTTPRMGTTSLAPEFTTPSKEVYLTPASTLRVPGGLGAISPISDDEKSPLDREGSTMAQLRAGLDPLFSGLVQGQTPASGVVPDAKSIQRKRSNLRLVFSKDEPLEPWELEFKHLYSQISALEDDPGMSSAGEEAFRSRRARALGRMSLRRRVGVDGDQSDYAADDSEVGEGAIKRREEKPVGFELARKLQQKSMTTFLEALLFVQFAVVLVVFVYTALRRGPKAVLGNQGARR